jgi:hypothetical protein
MKNKVATTIKIDPDLYDQFKVLGIHHKVTLQRLIATCIFRYVNEEKFREGVNEFTFPTQSFIDSGSYTLSASFVLS